MATLQAVECEYAVYGCTIADGTLNYDSTANVLSSCALVISGCTDSTANNYESLANTESGGCAYTVYGIWSRGLNPQSPDVCRNPRGRMCGP